MADSPAREPYEYKVCSSRKTYCVNVTPMSGITLYKNVSNNFERPVLITKDWYPQVYLSNDGRTLFVVGTTIVPGFTFDQPVVKIFVDAKLNRRLFVRDLIAERDLVQTSSGYSWGYPVGFSDGEKTFAFRTLSNVDFKISIDSQ
jgi:hypothetical protein